MKASWYVILMVAVLGVLSAAALAQQEPATDSDSEELDSFELVWPEQNTEHTEDAEDDTASSDAESPPGRPLLRLDIPEFTRPGAEQPAAAGTDQPSPVEHPREELTDLVRQLRDEVNELRHEVRRLRTTVELLAARLGGSSPPKSSAAATEVGSDEEPSAFYPFWLPRR